MFERYEGYKDSGVEWLGEIPHEWEVQRVKNLFKLITEKAHKGNNLELLSIYTELGVKPRKDMEARGNKSITTDDYWIVKKGDFIVNKLLAWMGAIALSNYNGVTSPAYDILRKKIKLNERYYEYLFRSKLAQLEFKKHSKGIMDVRLRLYFDKFGVISVPIQDLKVQTQITTYLDKKTQTIDKEINLLEQKIIKYKELKQTLINETVLRGLDKSVRLKESGVEWIGEIPEGWEVKRLKDIAKVFTGNSIASKELFEDSTNAYSYIATKDIDINTQNIVYENGIYVPFSDKNFKIAKQKSTLLCIEGGSAGKKIAYLNQDVCFVNKLCAITNKNNEINEKYLFYYLRASLFKNQFFSVMNGLIGGVSISVLKNFNSFIPLLNEQKQIANYLDEKTQKIDTIIETIQAKIDLLGEFRKTLINDAVTGKIKVAS